MTQKQPFFSFLRWAIFLFLVLGVYSALQRSYTVYVGCQVSPSFAKTIADGEQAAKAEQAKDPEDMKRVGQQMRFAKYTVRGVTAIIISGIIVWWRKPI